MRMSFLSSHLQDSVGGEHSCGEMRIKLLDCAQHCLLSSRLVYFVFNLVAIRTYLFKYASELKE